MKTLDEIRGFAPFKDMSEEGQNLLAKGLVRIDCPTASTVLHKGDTISGAYLVLSGSLRVYTLSPDGREATLYFIQPGETCVLALNCLFNDLLYPAWVEALGDTAVAHIPGPVYRRLFQQEVPIQNMTVQALSTLVFRLMGELELVHACDQKQRLANFILLHASSNGVLNMTQQQIAHHLGTTREVITRLIQEFVARDYVKTRRGSLTIKDLFGLRAVVAQKN